MKHRPPEELARRYPHPTRSLAQTALAILKIHRTGVCHVYGLKAYQQIKQSIVDKINE